MTLTNRATRSSDHDAFTARMHDVFSAYLTAVHERWPALLDAALAAQAPSAGTNGGEAPAQRLIDNRGAAAAPAQHLIDNRGAAAAPAIEVYCALKLPDGRLALSVYADETPELDAEERAALRAFQEPLSGLIFEVAALRGLCLRVHDAVRHRQIEVRTPPKPFPLQAFIRPGALLVCRLAPLRSYFTHLGPLQVIRAEDRSSLSASLQRQLAEQQRSGEEPVLRFLGLSGFGHARN